MVDTMTKAQYFPYLDLLGITLESVGGSKSLCSVVVEERHHNPHHVSHGGLIFSLADTGMGSALYPSLGKGEICATIEIKISYFKAVAAGKLRCETEVVNRGKRVATMESSIYLEDSLVARATGSYSIFTPKRKVS